MEALFRILVPDAAGPAWARTERDGDGELRVFSDEFVAPLAALSRTFQGKESLATDEELESVLQPLADSWVASRGRRGNGVSEQLDITDAAWWARAAQDRDQHLYAWFGPMVSLSGPYRRSASDMTGRR
jgi:hypothetical protein